MYNTYNGVGNKVKVGNRYYGINIYVCSTYTTGSKAEIITPIRLSFDVYIFLTIVKRF